MLTEHLAYLYNKQIDKQNMKEQIIKALEESKEGLYKRLEEEIKKLSDDEINNYLDSILKINQMIEELKL